MRRFIRSFFVISIILPHIGSAAIRKPDMAITDKGIVVSCEPSAAQAGVDILRKGGNAADAFIVTTLAEYVNAYGYTSISGPLYMLYFDAKSHSSIYLNAGLNQIEPGGPSYVVAGAARGLEELKIRYGSKNFSFSDLTAPAVRMARTGFQIMPWFARAIQRRAPLFAKSKEWNEIFMKDGKPLTEGQLLIQSKLADTLEKYGTDGADYFYKGVFANHLVETIRANEGKLTHNDLVAYKTKWTRPLQVDYRDYTVQTGSYRSYGGLEVLLGLKTIEHYKDIEVSRPFFEDKNVFEKVIRTYLFSYHKLMPFIAKSKLFNQYFGNTEAMAIFLNGKIPKELWNEVADSKVPAPWSNGSGHHSCNPIVIDRKGNIATGTHTINSLPWGDGLMVDGVSLNSARPVAGDAMPGERSLDGVAPVLIFKNGKPWGAAGFFAESLQPAALQILINLMDYGMPPNDAVFAPRFGRVVDYRTLALNLDYRFPHSWLESFISEGIRFVQPDNADTYIDTGDAMVIRIDAITGVRSGSPTEKQPFPVAIGE